MRIEKIQARIYRMFVSDRGATAVEYGLIVALIALAIIGAVFALGGTLTGLFEEVDTNITNPGQA